MAQKKKFYAVREGRIPGIYESWDDCKAQTEKYSGAIYKSFLTREEALLFLNPQKSFDPTENSDTAVAYVDGSYLHSEKKFSFGAVLFYGKNSSEKCGKIVPNSVHCPLLMVKAQEKERKGKFS